MLDIVSIVTAIFLISLHILIFTCMLCFLLVASQLLLSRPPTYCSVYIHHTPYMIDTCLDKKAARPPRQEPTAPTRTNSWPVAQSILSTVLMYDGFLCSVESS